MQQVLRLSSTFRDLRDRNRRTLQKRRRAPYCVACESTPAILGIAALSPSGAARSTAVLDAAIALSSYAR